MEPKSTDQYFAALAAEYEAEESEYWQPGDPLECPGCGGTMIYTVSPSGEEAGFHCYECGYVSLVEDE